MYQAASDFYSPLPALSPSFPYLRGTDAPIQNQAEESVNSPSRLQCSWQSTGGKMMFCTNAEIICADLIKLEWGTDRKSKEGSERHCLGVALLLFMLPKCSIILMPASPAVTGTEICETARPRACRRDAAPRGKPHLQFPGNSQTLSVWKISMWYQLAPENWDRQG